MFIIVLQYLLYTTIVKNLLKKSLYNLYIANSYSTAHGWKNLTLEAGTTSMKGLGYEGWDEAKIHVSPSW